MVDRKPSAPTQLAEFLRLLAILPLVPNRSPVQHEDMSAMVFLLIMIVISLAGSLFATDSRHSDYRSDSYWWPNR